MANRALDRAVSLATIKSRPDLLRKILLYVVLIPLSLAYFLPFIWVISTSLKTDPQVYRIPLTWIPNPVRWQNYADAMTIHPWGLFFWNTIKYGVGVVVGTLLSSSLVAYAFARMEWPGRDSVFFLVLATTMIPFQVRMIPLYLIFNKIGWLNTYKPLIIPSFLGNAYYIFLLRQFFRAIPFELSDAAKIDGASEIGIMTRIILPLAKPALAAVGLFQFMGAWNDYLGPIIYLKDFSKYPVALGLQLMRNISRSATIELLWPRLMAATALTIAPVLFIFFLTQRTFVEGITLTGIKG